MLKINHRVVTAAILVCLSIGFAYPTALLAAPLQTATSTVCVNRLEHRTGSNSEAYIASSNCYASDQLARQAIGASPLTSVVLGLDYNDSGYHGTSTYWTASSGCTSTQSWALNYVGDYWNDRISSAHGGFSNCNHYHHYQDIGYGGPQIDCHPDCSTMGVMNDATSSES